MAIFGFQNFTGFAFVGRIGNIASEFTFGVVEEITFNITGASAANAVEITELDFIPKDQIITTTSTVVSSTVRKTKLFDIILINFLIDTISHCDLTLSCYYDVITGLNYLTPFCSIMSFI